MAVLSLAPGIGANNTIFSLINSPLLRSLPVKEPQRLVLLDKGSWMNPIWEQIRDRQEHVFEGAAASSPARFDLARGGQAEFVEGLWVSGGFFELLGVHAIHGRTLNPTDDVRGGRPEGPAAVISYGFWQRHFGGAPEAVGKTLTLNRVPFTVAGVTPPGFFGPEVGRTFDVAIPIGVEPLMRGKESWLERRSTWWLEILARLKPGQSLQEAQSQLRAIQPQIRDATLPPDWRPNDLERYLRDGFELKAAAAGSSYLRDRYARPLLTLLVVAALVLLIACANIANLLMARAASRRHEMCVRIALGASRLRHARQLLAESLLLAAIGTGFGLLLAQWFSRLLVSQLSSQRYVLFLDLSFDWRTLAFAGGIALAAVLLFGMAPAFSASQANPITALTSRDRGIDGHRKGALSHPLVVVQVALSLVLIVAAGLFLRTFSELANLNLGFDRNQVIIVRANVQRSSVEPSGRAALFLRIRDAAASAPGVAHAAISAMTPVSGSTWNNLLEFPEGPPLTERERVVNMNLISPDWFATYSSKMLAGRDFDVRDRAGAPPVAIVNQAFAAKYFGGANPIGRSI